MDLREKIYNWFIYKVRKRCVKINETYSDYNEIISGVSQGIFV